MEQELLSNGMLKETYENLSDKYWRMNNLYWIVTEEGDRVRFKMKPEQEELFHKSHNRNVILKARQLGCTTFYCLNFLDECLFNANMYCGIVAHNLEDAQKFFREKIKFPYSNLVPEIKEMRPLKKDDGGELIISHGDNQVSGIKVGTSLRSGTYQRLLVSEYGKLCAKFPEKAKEVRTGALNTVSPSQVVAVESTAEGNEGHFYDICQDSELMQKSGEELTEMDYRFFFFPWWHEKRYRQKLPRTGLITPKRFKDYFRRLKAEHEIELDREQKCWYIKKEKEQGEDMKREFPSYPDEAFEAAIEGTYYSRQITEATEGKRICKVPHDRSVPVDCWWDLGISDYMSIWFSQNVGREIHFIDFFEGSDEGLQFYIDMLHKKRDELHYKYGRQVAPHDIQSRELSSGKSRLELAQNMGINFEIAPNLGVQDGIQAVRTIFSLCWFDVEKCDTGLNHLRNYRKQWNERLGVWAKEPRHDEHSHAADAFRYFGVSHNFSTGSHRGALPIVTSDSKGWT